MNATRSRHVLAAAALLALILAIASVLACSKSKSSNPTSPGSLELNSPDIAGGGMFAHTFAAAGSYTYHCKYHPPMTGTVTVIMSAPTLDGTVSITSSSAPFPAVQCKPGGTVTWTNNTGAPHTVTSP